MSKIRCRHGCVLIIENIFDSLCFYRRVLVGGFMDNVENSDGFNYRYGPQRSVFINPYYIVIYYKKILKRVIIIISNSK